VADELRLTLRCRGFSDRATEETVADRLSVFGLEPLADRSVFRLSDGQKQKVALAALTALKPRTLLLDEPSANLDPEAMEDLGKILNELRLQGLSLVVADHRLAWLREVCQEVLVLNRGRTVGHGGWEWLEDDETRLKLGLRAVRTPKLRLKNAEAETDGGNEGPGVEVEDLGFAYPGGRPIIENFSAKLPYGRIAALTGPSGRGKTTLARMLCGLEKPLAGRIVFSGETDQAAGSQAILQNADHQLYMPTVLDEVVVTMGQGRRDPALKGEAMEVLEAYGLAELRDRHPQSLSGGEKQRLVVAAGLARPTRLLALDEPTSGLDGRNLALMAAQIERAAAGGAAVLVITHDLELVALTAESLLSLGPSPSEERTASFSPSLPAEPRSFDESYPTRSSRH
jgi:energy-coupling factor transport system ATP-binding protein